jgi:hypothetical protein
MCLLGNICKSSCVAREFRVFLIEFGFAKVGSNGEPIFDEEMLRRNLNVNMMEISVDSSKTRACGRMEVSFHNFYLPLPSLSAATSSHIYTGIFGSNTAEECAPVPGELLQRATAEEMARLHFDFLQRVLNTPARFCCVKEREWPCTIGMKIYKVAWVMRSLRAISTIALLPSHPTPMTCQGSISCLRLTAAWVAMGRT